MKKNSATIMLLGCACFLLLTASMVRAQDAEATVKELSQELQQSGAVAQGEAEAMQASLKNMLGKGASKEELKGVITDLSKNDVKGEDLKKAVDSMNDLVNDGESPSEAGNVVSAAAAQAKEQGLKGKDLAAKVHEAIAVRKAARLEAKGKEEKAEKAGKAEQEVKVEAVKVEKEAPQKGKGK